MKCWMIRRRLKLLKLPSHHYYISFSYDSRSAYVFSDDFQIFSNLKYLRFCYFRPWRAFRWNLQRKSGCRTTLSLRPSCCLRPRGWRRQSWGPSKRHPPAAGRSGLCPRRTSSGRRSPGSASSAISLVADHPQVFVFKAKHIWIDCLFICYFAF